MAKPNPFRPFTPNPDMMALRPAITGDELNGVGETEVRRPSMMFWAPDPDDIAFGEVQRWFYQHEAPEPDRLAERAKRRAMLEAPLPELAPVAVERSPQEWTAALQEFIDAGDCERIGVTPLQPQWVFDHQTTEFKTVLVLGVQHDYEKLKWAPQAVAGTDVVRQYTRAATAAKKITGWLRQQGWDAEAATGPMVGKILMIPAAIAAGFGELGKHGSIINPEFGSAFRLSAVLTNAPLEATPPRNFGIDDFCTRCRVCEDACPPEAISPQKKTVRGDLKWSVNFDLCIPFFAETSGCAICIAVCPWSRPGVGLNLAEKLARRAVHKGEPA